MTYNSGKSKGINIMGEEIPLSYIVLEKDLDEQLKLKLKNKEVPILRREEFLNIATNIKCKDKFEDIEDIDAATKFLHNIGMYVCYVSY